MSNEIPKLKRRRPVGLWKVRVRTSRDVAPTNRFAGHTIGDSYSDHDGEHIWATAKRPRARYSSPATTATDSDDEVEYWDYSRQRSQSPSLPECSTRAIRTIIMDTSSTADQGETTKRKSASCDFEDWQDLKELFAKATEAYEVQEPAEALPLLRGVIHECHRFLLFYEDPSVLFATPPHKPTPEPMPPALPERLRHEWPVQSYPTEIQKPTQSPPATSRKCKCVELPTAFHAILGTTLFLFGNLMAQEPTLAMPGEPTGACPYWLAALDVFETGENLPSRTDGRSEPSPEDWRMAVVWGRTLICLADEAVTRAQKVKESGEPAPIATDQDFPGQEEDEDDPEWPEESPFATIAARRPPVARRTSLSTSTPHELMVLAMDQFSRGIFHMPHPQHAPAGSSMALNNISGSTSFPLHNECFSRAKELYTIASEVLCLAERLDTPSERRYWASWADSVFNQMKMEAALDMWRGAINRARGRCWLVVGSAYSEELEQALEEGEMDVLLTNEAVEARSGLEASIKFFNKAKTFAANSVNDPLDPESHELRQLQPLLAEALLTLANLTVDETKREELYARAQVEGGDNFDLDSDSGMDEDHAKDDSSR